jgi:hypothetical protein
MAATVGLELRAIDPVALQGVRTKDGRVSIYDTLQLVTGQELKECRKIWARLLQVHPELEAICPHFKFDEKGRGRHQQTPATDARGVVRVMMALPGQAGSLFRMNAADVLVRYLGGDPELVVEVCANRRAQEELAREQPEHPARLFGEAVETQATATQAVEVQAASPPALEEQTGLERQLVELQIQLTRAQLENVQLEKRKLRLENVSLSLQLAHAQGFAELRYREQARAAVNEGMLPPGESADGMLDAAQYLRLQGHSDKEVACMAGELGKWLKLRRLQECGEEAPTTTQDWGPEEREVHLYHRERDRVFLATSYAAFKERPLFARVCPPDTALQQRTQTALKGSRGMPRQPVARGRRARTLPAPR